MIKYQGLSIRATGKMVAEKCEVASRLPGKGGKWWLKETFIPSKVQQPFGTSDCKASLSHGCFMAVLLLKSSIADHVQV